MYNILMMVLDADTKYWEVIDHSETLEDAQYLLGEYRLAYGRGFALKIEKDGAILEED